MKLANVLAAVVILSFAGSVLAQTATTRPARGLRGTIVKVDGTNVVVKTMARGGAEGQEVTVATDDKTAVTIEGKEAKVADLKADLFVNVTPAEGTATKIVATATPPGRGLRGQIASVDGAKIVVKTRGRGGAEGQEVTVTTDDKTVVTIDGKDAKVADLKADLYVTVTPPQGTAAKIVATTNAPVRTTRPAAPPPANP